MSRKYYNAKPSKVSNIGVDVGGASRHRFNTYEAEAEKKARREHNRLVKGYKAELKAAILDDEPAPLVVANLLGSIFEAEHGFSLDNGRDIMKERRAEAVASQDNEVRKSYNKLLGAYNKARRSCNNLEGSYASYEIHKLQKRYRPKQPKFTEETGRTVNWKDFESVATVQGDADYMARNSQAVQFGNTVTDNERAYILKHLSEFLQQWQADDVFGRMSLEPLSWAFGARGKAGSVAYYQDGRKLISVNRNNIGSIVHEVGHFIDYQLGLVSSRIHFKTVEAYRLDIKERNPYLSSRDLSYYCNRKEIFARAFEAYCFSVNANFSEFAQCGKNYLPDLDKQPELADLVSEVFTSLEERGAA